MSSFSVYSPGLADVALLYDTVSKSICFVGGLGVAESYVNADRESVREMADAIVEVDEARLAVDGEAIGERWVGLEAATARPSLWRRLDLDLRSTGWAMVGSWVVNERREAGCCFCCGSLAQEAGSKYQARDICGRGCGRGGSLMSVRPARRQVWGERGREKEERRKRDGNGIDGMLFIIKTRMGRRLHFPCGGDGWKSRPAKHTTVQGIHPQVSRVILTPILPHVRPHFPSPGVHLSLAVCSGPLQCHTSHASARLSKTSPESVERQMWQPRTSTRAHHASRTAHRGS